MPLSDDEVRCQANSLGIKTTTEHIMRVLEDYDIISVADLISKLSLLDPRADVSIDGDALTATIYVQKDVSELRQRITELEFRTKDGIARRLSALRVEAAKLGMNIVPKT